MSAYAVWVTVIAAVIVACGLALVFVGGRRDTWHKLVTLDEFLAGAFDDDEEADRA